jgi:LacI family transcriptional regulator
MATMKDVATLAGVSLVTVWRALNEPDAVRANTLARVVAAIEELYYVPDQLASSLRSRQTGTIALLLPTIANAFWTAIARGVEDEGETRGYSVFLCNTDDNPTKEARYLDVLLRRRVEGIVIVPTAASATALQQARRRQMPIVQVHRKLDDVGADCIRADSRGGAAALTEQLLALGHRRVAYLGGLPTISPTRDCLAGYEAAMARAGIAVEPALVHLGRATPEVGHALTTALLAGDRPGALCIGNSRLAVGALHALDEAGVRVPDDLAVATFYDIAALDAYSPALITAVQPAYDIGRLGARRLLERIGGLAAPPEDMLLPNTIAHRSARQSGAVAAAAG